MSHALSGLPSSFVPVTSLSGCTTCTRGISACLTNDLQAVMRRSPVDSYLRFCRHHACPPDKEQQPRGRWPWRWCRKPRWSPNQQHQCFLHRGPHRPLHRACSSIIATWKCSSQLEPHRPKLREGHRTPGQRSEPCTFD